MISAEEARKMIGPIKEQYLNDIEANIKAAIEKKHFETIIRSEPYCYWLYAEKYHDATVETVLSELRELGYHISLYYKESQFVDMGLKISWKSA